MQNTPVPTYISISASVIIHIRDTLDVLVLKSKALSVYYTKELFAIGLNENKCDHIEGDVVYGKKAHQEKFQAIFLPITLTGGQFS